MTDALRAEAAALRPELSKGACNIIRALVLRGRINVSTIMLNRLVKLRVITPRGPDHFVALDKLGLAVAELLAIEDTKDTT